MKKKLFITAVVVGAVIIGGAVSNAGGLFQQKQDLAELQRQLRETQLTIINQYEQEGRLTPQEAMDWRQRIVNAKNPALLEMPLLGGQTETLPSGSAPGIAPNTIAPGSAWLSPPNYGVGGMMGGSGTAGGGGMMGSGGMMGGSGSIGGGGMMGSGGIIGGGGMMGF